MRDQMQPRTKIGTVEYFETLSQERFLFLRKDPEDAEESWEPEAIVFADTLQEAWHKFQMHLAETYDDCEELHNLEFIQHSYKVMEIGNLKEVR
jgi:hypothetical protein